MTQSPTVAAGDFSVWLGEIGRAFREGAEMDVPCSTCNACCKSSQFIHVERDESAVDHIPHELLFPTPGLPDGPLIMGYDANGHCPMLKDDACSIYAHRPRTCRVYDCRIFAASGALPDEATKTAVAERARQWEFSYTDAADEGAHKAIRAAAAFLSDPSKKVFHGSRPNAIRDSLIALSIYEIFMQNGALIEPTVDEVRAAIEKVRPSSR
jgi:Fe-S-cluster containining protein